jgi:dephospho-CoA kinase
MKKKMLVIGLTGGIGMGKSTAAKILRGFRLPVHNADQAVHNLLRKGGKAVRPVARLFPDTFKRGAIDREILGRDIFHRPQKLKKLEKILHPLVQQIEREFLRAAHKRKTPAAILEIPLLFETGAERRCDVTLCVTAPKAIQKARVIRRPGMNNARFKAILARQMTDSEKRRRADYIIRTGKGYADTKKQLRKILAQLLGEK